MDNCEVWGEVDFGEGKVRVRCTRTGDHTDHACHINLGQDVAGMSFRLSGRTE